MLVQLYELDEDAASLIKGRRIGTVNISLSGRTVYLRDPLNEIEYIIQLKSYQCMPLTNKILAFHPLENCDGNELKSLSIGFETRKECDAFRSLLPTFCSSTSLELEIPMKKKRKLSNQESKNVSEFDFRTEEGSATQYFQFYGSLFQQQNMMQDYTRTATYQRAIHENCDEFRDKVVLDVGAGSGILSFFAAQAGARRVYAVEASSMAEHCRALVSANGLSEVIKVITGKIEEIELPEAVDLIVSEPMGYLLVNERMLESYVYARKFLKKNGRMLPTKAKLHVALFSDEQLYLEQTSRCTFWSQESFHGVNLSALRKSAQEEIFRQPIVDTWHTGILTSKSTEWTYDFEQDSVDSLQNIEIPFKFTALRSGYIHGIASWFDVEFSGNKRSIWLSTAPTEPLTHWYQVRCLLKIPLFVTADQLVTGKLLMRANEKQSYDLDLEVEVNGQKHSNTLDLKTPYFRYTGQPIVQPPGNQMENPSDQLNQNLPSKEFQISDLLVAAQSTITNGTQYGMEQYGMG